MASDPFSASPASATAPVAPVALITGAARRVGAVVARHLHAQGFDLALHYRTSGEAMQALLAELNADRAGSAVALEGELGEPGTPQRLVDACIARFGRLDALINNASSFYPTPIGSATEADWDALFASNARAPFFLSQAAAPHLKASAGCIVNLVDVYAERPLAQHTLYCMAKSALLMMTLSLAKELGPEVRVNAVAPGAVLWPESGKPSAEQKALLDKTTLQRPGRPEDVAEAIAYLLRAQYTSGQVLRVDGGRALNI
jgi:pteridine reductase